jgi:predicted nucleotidyltransferase component of viral defense system
MSIKLIQERLNSYNCKSHLEEHHAVREITQELALAALSRTDFFKYASFQGGTCLRIFYGLSRFFEDLDFLLDQPDPNFDLKPFLHAMSNELLAYGYRLDVTDKSQTDIAVRKAFIKDDSIGKILLLNYLGKTGPAQKIRIKLEIDSNPPSGSHSEIKYLDFPFICSVVVQDKPSLFAGKLHALLCRQYIKGRDWYDFLWYTAQNISINYRFLTSALNQQGPWKGQDLNIDRNWIQTQLENIISSIDWNATKEDVRRFVKVSDQPSLELWSKDLFLNQLKKIK